MAPGRLYEREVAALVIRAGRASGFVVRAEIPAPWAKLGSKGKNPALDYGWFDPKTNQLLIAWELDGRDVGKAHIIGDGKAKPGNAKKFAGCNALLKIQVLFSVENALTDKPPSNVVQVRTLLPRDVVILTDEELMAPPPAGIDDVVRQLKSLAARQP